MTVEIIRQHEVMALINTSTSDAEISLKGLLATDPQRAEEIATIVLGRIEGLENQKTRRALVNRIIRQAKKALKSK